MALFAQPTRVGQTRPGPIQEVRSPALGSLAQHRDVASTPDPGPERPRSLEDAEEACRRGENLLRTIINSSRAVIFLKDSAGRYLLVNRQWTELLGITPEMAVGRTDHDLFPVEIADGLRLNDLKVLASEQPVELEELLPHGETLHTYLSIKVPVLDAHGVPYAICGISTDITERNRMEEALRLSEEQFRGAFDNAAIGVALVDPEGEWLRVNPALCETVGYSEEEIRHRTIQDFFDPKDREAAETLMGKLLAGEIGAFQTEKRFVHKAGKVLWVRLSMSVVRNLAGRTLHFVVQVEDVTRRRQAEEIAGDLHTGLQDAYDATIAGWGRALDLRDHDTEGHSRRVTDVTIRLAEAVGVSAADRVHIRRGALLHDIGKMGVPDAILLKPGPLTEDEQQIMRRHPDLAAEMLQPIAFLRPALEIPHCHHERWDGTGYPRGLVGDEIPLAARIFAVVDLWDALTHDRPYRLAWPEDRVCEHLRSLAGTHLDPAVVAVFLDQTMPALAQVGEPVGPALREAGSVAPVAPDRTSTAIADPVKDPARIAALRASGLLDSPADLPLDRLVLLASQVLRAPVALLSLVDDHRQFFKSSYGLPEPWASYRETPLSHSFCQEVVRGGTSLVVADARLHPLVCTNRAVAELGVVAYAGIPLKTGDGQILGSFCVIDVEPRSWTEEELGILESLAAAVMTEIELRSDIAARQRVEDELRRSQRRVAEQLCVATELNSELKGHRRDLAGATTRLIELAATDCVTGLKNRRYLDEVFPLAYHRATHRRLPLSVIRLDIDGFRQINIDFGHRAGEDVLRGVAAAFLGQIRGNDLAVRHGAGEFVILLPDIDAPAAEGVAERLRASVADRPFEHRPVTASLGVATSGETDRDPWAILDRAVLALGWSIGLGRNRVTHHRSMTDGSTPPVALSGRPLAPADHPPIRAGRVISRTGPASWSG